MVGDKDLKKNWELLLSKLSKQFADGDVLDIDTVVYLVGLQEVGVIHEKLSKQDKTDLMHVAVCRLLVPYGYYKFDFVDQDGWPHYNLQESLPLLKSGEQQLLIKEALVHYFLEQGYI